MSQVTGTPAVCAACSIKSIPFGDGRHWSETATKSARVLPYGIDHEGRAAACALSDSDCATPHREKRNAGGGNCPASRPSHTSPSAETEQPARETKS